MVWLTSHVSPKLTTHRLKGVLANWLLFALQLLLASQLLWLLLTSRSQGVSASNDPSQFSPLTRVLLPFFAAAPAFEPSPPVS